MFGKAFSRIRHFWPVIILLGLAILMANGTAQAKPVTVDGKVYNIAEPGDFYPDQLVIKVKPGVSKDEVAGLAAANQAKVKKSLPEYDLYLVTLAPGSGASAQKAQAAAKGFLNFSQVEAAFPNYKFSIPMPVLPKAAKKGAPPPAAAPAPGGIIAQNTLTAWQWHLYRIKYPTTAPPASAPIVAVIDTGVDASHPDLAGNVLPGYDFVNDMPGATTDGAGHGTHVAGIIAARSGATFGVMGVSPTSKILPVRVLDNTGSGSLFDIMAGVTYAKNYAGVKVLNLSLGGYLQVTDPAYNTFKAVFDAAFAAGKVVCVAAGNENNYYLYRYESTSKYRPVPAYYPNCFTVAASQEVDARAYFSNYNASFPAPYNYTFNYVDIVAPGWDILSTVPDGGHEYKGGTSMATPVVAGCAARVFAAGYATNTAVQTRLLSTAKLIPTGSGFPAYPTTQKRVDLGKALGATATGLCGVVYNGAIGKPLAGATVQATATGGATVTGTTNGAGFFTLVGLTAARAYNLTISKAGFSTFNYAAANGTTTTVAATITDVPMPVFLNQVRPAGQWSVVIAYHTWHPGYDEATITYPSKPSWYPINWDQTDGLYFAPKVYRNGTLILDPSYRGDLMTTPFAAITHDPFDFTHSGVNVVIKSPGTNTYRINGRLDNINDSFYEWGKYKGVNQNVVAFVYYGATLKTTIKANAAGGTGAYWKIADLKPGGVCTVLNTLSATP